MDDDLDLAADSRPIVWGMTGLDPEAAEGLRAGLQERGVDLIQIAGSDVGGAWPPPATVALTTADGHQSNAIRSLYQARFSGPVVLWRRPGQHGYVILSADDQDRLKELNTIHVTDSSVLGLVPTLLMLCQPDLEVVALPSPSQPAILTVNEFLSEVFERAAKDASVLRSLTSRQYEEFTAELFRRSGFQDVTLTGQTRDKGVDGFASLRQPFGAIVIAFECKKYREDRPVGVEIVRAFAHATPRNDAHLGVLCTTSRFSREAVEEAQVSKIVQLQDVQDIHAWILRVSGI